MSKRQPPLSIDGTRIYHGRRDLRAVYQSSNGTDTHTTSAHDDGSGTYCTCLGYQHTGNCWHIAAIVDDYWRSVWGDADLDELRQREDWLLFTIAAGAGDEGDQDSARLELGTIGDILSERMGRAA